MKHFYIAVLFICLLGTSAFAQTAGPNGFYYPVASINTAATFLETSCHGYVAGEYHLGWDLAQSHPSPVYAITDGTVVNNPYAIYPLPGQTDPTNGDETWIWVQHQAVDPSTGNTFTFYAVYGHTSPINGLKPGSPVQAGHIIGYTITYHNNDNLDHCHLGINRNGIVTSTHTFSNVPYINSSGQSASMTVTAGWGRGGTLPNGWCGHDNQNIASLQASGAVENFTDPQAFLNTYHAVGYGGGLDSTNPYVDGSYSGTQVGTALNPFKTVTQAVNAASASGATIHIKAGSYPENITISKNVHIVTWGSGTVRIGS